MFGSQTNASINARTSTTTVAQNSRTTIPKKHTLPRIPINVPFQTIIYPIKYTLIISRDAPAATLTLRPLLRAVGAFPETALATAETNIVKYTLDYNVPISFDYLYSEIFIKQSIHPHLSLPLPAKHLIDTWLFTIVVVPAKCAIVTTRILIRNIICYK